MAMKPILIIGCGPGGTEYVTDAARQAAASAAVLFGAPRLLALFPGAKAEQVAWEAHAQGLDRIEELRRDGQQVGVLVSGDPGLFSLAQTLVRRFGPEHCRIIPAVSSVQVAFARLGLDWADATIVSAHGRTPAVAPDRLRTCEKIAILAGTDEALDWAGQAAAALAATHEAIVCENLTLPGERIRHSRPDDIAAAGTASLAIVLLLRKERCA